MSSEYSTFISDYLFRIRKLLDDNSDASLLYAALELRCAVEARMQEYLNPVPFLSAKQKKEWSISKLGMSIANAFKSETKIAIFTIYSDDGNALKLRYIPVSQDLQDIAKKLGDYLHYKREPFDSARLRRDLERAYAWLAFANSGEIYGMPLLNGKNVSLSVSIPDDKKVDLSSLKIGVFNLIHVDYQLMPNDPPAL